MKTINQYIIKPDQGLVLIPSNGILSASSLGDDVVVYALVDSEDMEGRPFEFKIFGTNSNIDVEVTGYNFLGTVTLHNGSTIHVFYKGMSSVDL